ncbi:MAG TPA: hypothetical protein V6C65_01360 [Allocoleopsis sp.]
MDREENKGKAGSRVWYIARAIEGAGLKDAELKETGRGRTSQDAGGLKNWWQIP